MLESAHTPDFPFARYFDKIIAPFVEARRLVHTARDICHVQMFETALDVVVVTNPRLDQAQVGLSEQDVRN